MHFNNYIEDGAESLDYMKFSFLSVNISPEGRTLPPTYLTLLLFVPLNDPISSM